MTTGSPLRPRFSRHSLVRRVERVLANCDRISDGASVLVAVSGGADSVFLARALHALARPRGDSLQIGHFNHRWRGVESDADESFVRKLAQSLDLPVHVGSARTSTRRAGRSPEAAARTERYRFFARTCARERLSLVATGHTLDDQLETYLIGWLRGSGPAGASLMPSAGALPVPRTAARLIRPLLTLGRDEIRRALTTSGWEWREDRSNQDPRFLRNRVRAELIPLLESLTPGAKQTILRSAAFARDAATYLTESATAEVDRLFSRDAAALTANRDAFLALHPVLRAPALQRAVTRMSGSAADVESAHLAAAVGLITRGAGRKQTPLGHNAVLTLSKGQVRIGRRAVGDPPPAIIAP